MTDHTAPELLEAVGYDWRNQPDMAKWRIGDGSLKSMRELHEGHYTYCLHHATYTGPALGTPELDALLLVAGQRWCVEKCPHGIPSPAVWIAWQALLDGQLPGHALARAIREG